MATPCPSAAPRPAVLLAGAEPGLLHAFGVALRRAGLAVTLCESAFDGMRLLHDRRFDLLVLDLLMPDADRLPVATRLRADVRPAVLFLAPAEERGTRRFRLAPSAGDTSERLARPISPSDLVARALALLRRNPVSPMPQPAPAPAPAFPPPTLSRSPLAIPRDPPRAGYRRQKK